MLAGPAEASIQRWDGEQWWWASRGVASLLGPTAADKSRQPGRQQAGAGAGPGHLLPHQLHALGESQKVCSAVAQLFWIILVAVIAALFIGG